MHFPLLGACKLLLYSDVSSDQHPHPVIADDAGEDTLRIQFLQYVGVQVCGNDRGLFAYQAFVDAEEELGGDEGVRKLRAQIINRVMKKRGIILVLWS